MLAEIYMLRLEAAARAAREAATSSSRFVPVSLPGCEGVVTRHLFYLFRLRPRLPGVPALLKLRLGHFQGRHARPVTVRLADIETTIVGQQGLLLAI